MHHHHPLTAGLESAAAVAWRGAGEPPTAPPAIAAASAADLARRARAGDREAFGRLYESFAPMVHGLLLAASGPRAAQDLLQDVFLVALRSIAELREPERVGPWLASIARNRARDWLRSRGAKAAEPIEGAELALQASAAPEEEGEEEEAARALGVLRSLPEAYRETLTLRLVEGLSGPEIAARCGMTHGSVRVNLFRGMKLLRERLEREAAG